MADVLVTVTNPVGDATLMEALRNGEESALAAVYDRYSQIVYSIALRVMGDTGAAEDVLQDVFMQLWRNPDAFDGGRGSLGAWLAVITRHRAIDLLRKRKPETFLEEVVVPVDIKLENESEKIIILNKIREILKGLPAEQRKVMEMSFFEGLTHTEIAVKTGAPLGTVKTRIRSGLTSLRKVLA